MKLSRKSDYYPDLGLIAIEGTGFAVSPGLGEGFLGLFPRMELSKQNLSTTQNSI